MAHTLSRCTCTCWNLNTYFITKTLEINIVHTLWDCYLCAWEWNISWLLSGLFNNKWTKLVINQIIGIKFVQLERLTRGGKKRDIKRTPKIAYGQQGNKNQILKGRTERLKKILINSSWNKKKNLFSNGEWVESMFYVLGWLYLLFS